MTAMPPLDSNEPPPPQRGLTREEHGRDVSEAQAEVEAETSTWKKLLKSMSLRRRLAKADGYGVVIKVFLQFCLILIYPAWVFAVLVGSAIYGVFYGVLWVLFWPVRAVFKRTDTEEYEVNPQKNA